MHHTDEKNNADKGTGIMTISYPAIMPKIIFPARNNADTFSQPRITPKTHLSLASQCQLTSKDHMTNSELFVIGTSFILGPNITEADCMTHNPVMVGPRMKEVPLTNVRCLNIYHDRDMRSCSEEIFA